MMWFKRKIHNWVAEIEKEKYSNQGYGLVEARHISESAACDKEPVLHFRVFSAIGGRIIEFRHHDQKSDRSKVTTYIINDNDDFGECIKQISTMEMLK